MYFISFIHKFPKFKRFPLQGSWQNAVIYLNMPQSTRERSTITREALAVDSQRTPNAVTDGKHSATEMHCFLPDVDIERCVYEADNSLKILALEMNSLSPVVIDKELGNSCATECSSDDMEDSDSDDSDITLNDIESYACFENDEISHGFDAAAPAKPMRRRLPSVKRQKYDYVQSKVKQYVKSKAAY